MVRRLGVLFISVVCYAQIQPVALAQRSDTVWQSLANTVGTAGTFVSTSVNNIGQTGHTLYINDAGCVTPNYVGGLQYSWDNTNWTTFGFALSVANPATGPVLLNASGAFPYVRARFFYNSACGIPTVFYTGVIANPLVLSQGLLPTDSQIAINSVNSPSPVIGGSVVGVADNSLNTFGISAPTVEGGTTQNVSVGVGTTVKIGTALTTVVATRWYISHLDLTADTNATVITLIEGGGTTCGTSPTTLGTWFVNAGIPLIVGKMRTQTVGDNLCISAATGTVSGSITFGQIISVIGGY